MTFFDRQHAWLLVLLLLGISSAYAQTNPDAGALRQQIERQRPQVLPGEKKPLTVLPPEYKAVPGLTVTVKQFRFTGNTLLTAEQITPALASFVDRPLDFAGLQQATAAVSDAYRAAGWLVRVYLPRQDITDGVVTLQIVESVFGMVRLEGVPPSRLTDGRAEATIAAAQQAGQALNATALDRAMLLLDDLPGVAVSGNLAPGSGQAETDLLLQLVDEPLLNGEVGLDNTGSRSTGPQRLTANAFLNSPLKMGDQLSANLVHTEGSNYARLAYALPVGHDGLRLGINASRLNYQVITPEFAAANINGNSTSSGIDAQYPLVRSRTHNLYLSAAFDNKAFDNQANSATTTQYGVRSISAGLMGNQFDKWGGGGANMASMTLTAGEVDLDRSPNMTADAATTQTHGNFSKLRYALSRQQALTADLSLYALVTGQWANKNLDSSEKFFLGGANGVRAYPSSEGGGSEGAMLNLELRWRAMNNIVVTGFYDWGSVTTNKHNGFAGAPVLNRFDLHGLGASIAWTGPGGLTLKGTLAHRLGDNPNRDAPTGNDQDGTLTKTRLWFTASLPLTVAGSRTSTVSTHAVVETKPISTAKENDTPTATSAATATETVAAPMAQPPAPPAPAVTPAAPAEAKDGAIKIGRGVPLVISDVRSKSSELSPSTKAMLDEVAHFALQNPTLGIEISGHTDRTSVSKYAFNLRLSEQRALDAKSYLIAKGVPANQIKTAGFSYTQPIAGNETQAGRDQNRRIEVRFINSAATP